MTYQDHDNSINLPHVSIVMIGHNESKTLSKALVALANMSYPRNLLEIIYVDSNSTDESVNIASNYVDLLIQLKDGDWHTAGEAFNQGILKASHDYIHITAGDIVLDPEYLQIAITTLLGRDDISVVTGYFEEENNDRWNRILGYRRQDDVNTEDHFVLTPNGGTFRKSAFFSINGYDERIKKGQETEIGVRLRKNGHKILYKHIRQGIHDFDLNSFSDLLRRFFNDGKSQGYMLLLGFKEPYNESIRHFQKSAQKTLLLHSAYVLPSLLLLFLKPLFAIVPIILYLCYGFLSIRLKTHKLTKQYRIYRYIVFCCGLFNYCGILSLVVRYCYLMIFKRKNLIKPRQGLVLAQS